LSLSLKDLVKDKIKTPTHRKTPMTNRLYASSSRRVSFEVDDLQKRRCVGLTLRGMNASSLASTLKTLKDKSSYPLETTGTTPLSILKKNRQQHHATELRGRIMKQRKNDIQCFDYNPDQPNSCKSTNMSSIRSNLDRKMVFARLLDEMKQLQQQVTTLEATIRDHQVAAPFTSTGTANEVENEWRIRVLLKAAQESDQTLWTKLYEYEKTLLVGDADSSFHAGTTTPNVELRDAQTACMKLHRDFKRCHKALLLCLSLVVRNDSSTMALIDDTTKRTPLIDSVGWTGHCITKNRSMPQLPINVSNELDAIDNSIYSTKRILPRSVSPIPEYTSFRPLKNKDDSAKLTYHAKTDHATTTLDSLRQDEKNDGAANNCLVESPMEENKCCDGYSDVDNDDYTEDNHWICGALNFQNQKKDDNDDEISSFVSSSKSNYQQWYKTIQDELHSMQLDLLHVRSNMVAVGWGRHCNDGSNSRNSSDDTQLIDDYDDDNIIVTKSKQSR
jgi:hypothetical protein